MLLYGYDVDISCEYVFRMICLDDPGGLRSKLAKFIQRHPFWNIRQDPIVKAFTFGHEDKPLRSTKLAGIVFVEERDLKKPRRSGGSEVISLEPSMMREYGFDGKNTRQRVLKVTESSFLKPDSPVIVICREQDEKIGG